MDNVVRTRIVKIGNSQGVRIPKVLLEQSGLGEEVELAVRKNQLVIRSIQRPRQGWDKQFQFMAEQGDDRLLDEAGLPATDWDRDEWEWE